LALNLGWDPTALAPEVLRAALSRGGEFAELFVEDSRTVALVLDGGRIERVTAGGDRGAGVRVIHHLHTAYGYTNDLSPRGLRELGREVAQAARGGHATVFAPQTAVVGMPVILRRDPARAPLPAKASLLRRADAAARAADARIGQVTARYGDVRRAILVVNSLGEWAEDETVQTLLSVTCVAQAGADLVTGFESHGGCGGMELIEDRTPEDIARVAARRAIAALAGRPPTAGRMPVVLSSSAGGTMVHEALGHGLEADLTGDGLSIYEGRVGETIASPLVTVYDDATLAGKRGSFAIDDEGTPAERTTLVQAGVLRGYLRDRLSAMRAGLHSTGNGRRESYRFRPIVRMTNTMIAPGPHDPAEILRTTERGLFVRQMGGGEVETVSGNFVFEVTEGYLIEHGAVGAPVRGATLTGNGPEVLASIDRVGRDLGFGIGTCGKDGQSVPIADAQPTIRIPELTVGGRT
jgi:TldD protein